MPEAEATESNRLSPSGRDSDHETYRRFDIRSNRRSPTSEMRRREKRLSWLLFLSFTSRVVLPLFESRVQKCASNYLYEDYAGLKG